MKSILLPMLLIGFLAACSSQSEPSATEDLVLLKTPKAVGDVKTLDDVYKLAFDEAKATITYETANQHLDTIENEIQKELSEVAQ
jgi:hypothetical protein